MTDDKKSHGEDKNQGEGDIAAARRYRQDSEDFADSGDVEKQAEDARQAVEEDKDGELERAEQAGKEKAKEFDPQVKRD